ncbi:MAG: alpha/beta fold hydrolase [Deltaproteobacteria bacterium]
MKTRSQKSAAACLPARRVEFAGRRGNLLVGDFYAAADGKPLLVLCHGMESTRGGTKQQAIIERFVPQGYGVLSFDFAYVGESQGEFEDLTISGEVDDCLAALDFAATLQTAACILVGSSLGGAVALLSAARSKHPPAAVATIAALTRADLFTEGLDEVEIKNWRDSGRRSWRQGYLKVGFLEDVQRLDILAEAASAAGPLLAMHGDADVVVPVEHAYALSRVWAGPVRLEIFAGVGHRFEEPGALGGLIDTLEDWLDGLGGTGGT